MLNPSGSVSVAIRVPPCSAAAPQRGVQNLSKGDTDYLKLSEVVLLSQIRTASPRASAA